MIINVTSSSRALCRQTMQHELHDGIDWFTTSTNSKQLHDVLVVKPLHQLSLTQEIQLQHARSHNATNTTTDVL